MKKLLAIVLALVLALSMTAVAFAANPDPIESNNGTANAEVWVRIDKDELPDDAEDVDPDSDDVVYYVEIDASDAEFTYTFDSASYDPETHLYNGGSWDKESADIIVTNNSNTSINVTAAWKDNGGELNNVKATLTDTTTPIKLPSAVNKAVGDASLDATITVTLTNYDDVPPSTLEDFRLDYVTITIAGTTAD